jgi:hypothetical protein
MLKKEKDGGCVLTVVLSHVESMEDQHGFIFFKTKIKISQRKIRHYWGLR